LTLSESVLARCAHDLETSLTKERGLYEQLARLALEAKQALERQDDGGLSEVLQRKRELITELRRVVEETDRAQHDFSEHGTVPEQIQARVSSALKRTNDALGELLRLERANEDSVRAARNSIGTELRELTRGRHMLEGYRAPHHNDPLFVDKRR
jgi:chromosome segregation ATPase